MVEIRPIVSRMVRPILALICSIFTLHLYTRHIGFWNLVGSVGFTLCGALGYGAVGHPWMNYQSILATFWGSWSFMVGFNDSDVVTNE